MDDREKLIEVASKMLHQHECTIEAITVDLKYKTMMVDHITSLIDQVNDIKILREAIAENENTSNFH